MDATVARRLEPPSRVASAVATLAFAYEAYFFLVAGKSGTALAGGLAWGAYATALFAAIAFGGKPEPWRRVFFFSMAVTFVPSFMAHLVEARGHMAVTDAEVASASVPFCHIALTTSILPAAILRTLDFPARLTGTRAAFYPMLAYWLLSLVTLGRGWCSWVCFYGGVEDGLSSLRRKPAIVLDKRGAQFRRWNRAVLAFVALAGLGTLVPVYCDWLCPFKTVTEFAEPTDIRSYLAMIAFIGLYLGLVVVLPILSKKRVQCSLLCPFGAMQSMLDRLSPFVVSVDRSRCIGCGACERACPALAIDKEARAGGRARPSCVKCGTCFSACPVGALGYSARLKAPSGLPLARLPFKLAAYLSALASPGLLFPFTAMSFGLIISTAFSAASVEGLARLAASAVGALVGAR